MNIDIKDKYKVVTPEEGMWLTDGSTISDKVYMPLGADVSKWYDITEEQKDVLEVKNSEITEESTVDLDSVKERKIAEVVAYDTSDAVNGFTYQGQTMWIDKATRVGLVNAVDSAILLGKETITFGIGGISVTLPCDVAKAMLAQLELYALECYNVTLAHKNAVAELSNVADVEAYDITVGYPKKLAF